MWLGNRLTSFWDAPCEAYGQGTQSRKYGRKFQGSRPNCNPQLLSFLGLGDPICPLSTDPSLHLNTLPFYALLLLLWFNSTKGCRLSLLDFCFYQAEFLLICLTNGTAVGWQMISALNRAREHVPQIWKSHFRAAAVKEKTTKEPSGAKFEWHIKVLPYPQRCQPSWKMRERRRIFHCLFGRRSRSVTQKVEEHQAVKIQEMGNICTWHFRWEGGRVVLINTILFSSWQISQTEPAITELLGSLFVF